MQPISTPDAPAPAGHYSQAMVHGDTIYVAGQLPKNPADPDAPPGDAGSQTRQALANVGAILDAAGSSLSQVLQMTIYVADIELWPAVNEAYAEVMGGHRPARAVVPVKELHHGWLIEIQAVATR
jgi:2-iminobutanoate/2-iminopropanoate deaminase